MYCNAWTTYFKHVTPKRPSFAEYLSRQQLVENYVQQAASFGGKFRHILIAEAPYPRQEKSLEDWTYFYEHRALGTTPYFTQPYKVAKELLRFPRRTSSAHPLFNEVRKAIALTELAQAGMLLVDLFPFSIPYTTLLRKQLTQASETYNAVDWALTNNVLPFLQRLHARKLLDANCKVVLMAPPTIGDYILETSEIVFRQDGTWLKLNQSLNLRVVGSGMSGAHAPSAIRIREAFGLRKYSKVSRLFRGKAITWNSISQRER